MHKLIAPSKALRQATLLSKKEKREGETRSKVKSHFRATVSSFGWGWFDLQLLRTECPKCQDIGPLTAPDEQVALSFLNSQ